MFICDAHADTLFNLLTNPENVNDISKDRLVSGGVGLQTLAMYVGPKGDLSTVKRLFKGMLQVFDGLKKQGWTQVDDPSEAEEDKVKFMLSIEGCEVFCEGLCVIDEYRELGVRMAALVWNHINGIGTPAIKDDTTGLTKFGYKALRRMEEKGIAVDLSHLNIQGFYDVLSNCTKPPLASHSCCRAICNHPRNLDDEQLKALFEAGGFVGLNFYPTFLNESGKADLGDILRHIHHMYSLGGEGKVGFGSDFDGIETKPIGLEHPGHFPALIERLREDGLDSNSIKLLASGAFLEYYSRLQ